MAMVLAGNELLFSAFGVVKTTYTLLFSTIHTFFLSTFTGIGNLLVSTPSLSGSLLLSQFYNLFVHNTFLRRIVRSCSISPASFNRLPIG